MNKHDRTNLREWWTDKKYNAKHGKYDWAIPIVLLLVGVAGWAFTH